MIECRHKNLMTVLNEGFVVENCSELCRLVNSKICEKCPLKDGKIVKPQVEMDLPVRNDRELQSIQNVCEQCPIFNQETQTCRKMDYPTIPVSTLAQHPSRHCPERKW